MIPETTALEPLKQALIDYADTLLPKVGEVWVWADLPNFIAQEMKVTEVDDEIICVEYCLRLTYTLSWWAQEAMGGRLRRRAAREAVVKSDGSDCPAHL